MWQACSNRDKRRFVGEISNSINRESIAVGVPGLHCGSGGNLHLSCLNTDAMALSDGAGVESKPGEIVQIRDRWLYLQHDATTPFPLADNSFDWAYSEHFIEHVSSEQAVAWLAEVRRMVRPGGFLRLSTPDLAKYVAG